MYQPTTYDSLQEALTIVHCATRGEARDGRGILRTLTREQWVRLSEIISNAMDELAAKNETKSDTAHPSAKSMLQEASRIMVEKPFITDTIDVCTFAGECAMFAIDDYERIRALIKQAMASEPETKLPDSPTAFNAIHNGLYNLGYTVFAMKRDMGLSEGEIAKVLSYAHMNGWLKQPEKDECK